MGQMECGERGRIDSWGYMERGLAIYGAWTSKIAPPNIAVGNNWSVFWMYEIYSNKILNGLPTVGLYGVLTIDI